MDYGWSPEEPIEWENCGRDLEERRQREAYRAELEADRLENEPLE